MTIIKINGVRTELEAIDLNNDGVSGGVEVISRDNRVSLTSINPLSDLGDSLREINKDSIEEGTNMSGIDLRSRIHNGVLAPITALDSLVALRVFPKPALGFTRQWKRNSVSLNGLGRNEHVQMVAGNREVEANKNKSFAERIREAFKPNKKS